MVSWIQGERKGTAMSVSSPDQLVEDRRPGWSTPSVHFLSPQTILSPSPAVLQSLRSWLGVERCSRQQLRTYRQ